MQSTNLRDLLTLRPLDEYHEDMGDVLWWIVPLTESPWVGTPNTAGYPVNTRTYGPTGILLSEHTVYVGGWPGYHTHWSPLPMAVTPAELQNA